MVLVPNPGGFVSTSHENGMSPPTGLKPAPMTGIYPFRGGPGRADTRGHAHLFHVGTGRTAAQSQATRRQPAVSVADLLRRDRCDRFAPQVVWRNLSIPLRHWWLNSSVVSRPSRWLRGAG